MLAINRKTASCDQFLNEPVVIEMVKNPYEYSSDLDLYESVSTSRFACDTDFFNQSRITARLEAVC